MTKVPASHTHHKAQPRTQSLTYGKDPGWGWSRDFTKIDWLRGEGRVSNCMLPQKNVTLQLQGVDQSRGSAKVRPCMGRRLNKSQRKFK
jgi:hypothetical protein